MHAELVRTPVIAPLLLACAAAVGMTIEPPVRCVDVAELRDPSVWVGTELRVTGYVGSRVACFGERCELTLVNGHVRLLVRIVGPLPDSVHRNAEVVVIGTVAAPGFRYIGELGYTLEATEIRGKCGRYRGSEPAHDASRFR